MKKYLIPAVGVLTAMALLVGAIPAAAADADKSGKPSSSYFDLYDTYTNESRPETEIKTEAVSYTSAFNKENALIIPDGTTKSVLIGNNNKWAEWQISVPEDGVYNLVLEYRCILGTGFDIQASLMIDGAVPYKEVNPFALRRSWSNATSENENSFEKDEKGNDLQPGQKEVFSWITDSIYNRSGLFKEPYLFSLTRGTHTIRLTSVEGEIAVKSFSFINIVAIKYDEYIKNYSDKSIRGETVIKQAENLYSTNNSSVAPTADRTTASTQPNDPVNIRLNTIGSTGWQSQGDAISWKPDIKKPGLYKISMRARQSANASMSAYRSLYINGKLPFSEAENIAFPYSTKWYTKNLAGKSGDYYFYLEPDDILTLVCTTGDMSSPLRTIQEATTELNTLYLEIISYTSVTPDTYQDYKLETKISDLSGRMTAVSDMLKSASKQITKITGSEGSQASSIDYAITIIDRYIASPYLITEQLNTFKSALETISSLLQTINSCPLELDYISFVSEGAKALDNKIGFFKEFSFIVKQFMASFANDYSVNGDNGSKASIKVWVSTGRDQVQVMNSLIRNSFTVNTGIKVDLNIVDTGQTLIKASLAGKGPDAALMMPITVPVNLAARGAVVDLNDYDADRIKSDFYSSAFTPFYYREGLYAFPETQTFNMIFYRTDIFKQYGLSAPETWKDFYNIMEVLQSHNMMVGVPETSSENAGVSAGLGIFEMLLIQNGGEFYNKDFSKTKFDEPVAYEAFKSWVSLYKNYGLDRQYDFYSRFRTGEMPMAIASLSSYASLQAAPELQGLWTIAPVPGTVVKNGLNFSEPSEGTGCCMLKSAVRHKADKEAAQFLKWWVSTETQAEYGVQLERTLGVMGRYYTANKTAFKQLAWSSEEREVIDKQWAKIYNQPQIPGNYVIQRSLTSALRSVLDSGYRSTRALTTYNYDMNEELARKLEEFRGK